MTKKLTGIYVYCGDGAGVAGLAHRVDADELDADQLEILAAAVENGNYKAEGTARKSSASPKASEEA